MLSEGNTEVFKGEKQSTVLLYKYIFKGNNTCSYIKWEEFNVNWIQQQITVLCWLCVMQTRQWFLEKIRYKFKLSQYPQKLQLKLDFYSIKNICPGYICC